LDVDKFKLDCANYAGESRMNFMFANQVTIMKPNITIFIRSYEEVSHHLVYRHRFTH